MCQVLMDHLLTKNSEPVYIGMKTNVLQVTQVGILLGEGLPSSLNCKKDCIL